MNTSALVSTTVTTNTALSGDEFKRWCQGGCLDYARALLRLYPELRPGSFGTEEFGYYQEDHYFAQDGTYAYDATGRHLMPYLGIDGKDGRRQELDVNLDDYDEPYEPDIADALEHIERNRIGPSHAAPALDDEDGFNRALESFR